MNAFVGAVEILRLRYYTDAVNAVDFTGTI